LMEKQLEALLEHVAKAHEELSRILKSTKEISMHTAEYVVGELPDRDLTFGGQDVILNHALMLAGNVTAYLNSLGELEAALADSLEPVMEQLHGQSDEE